MKIIKYMDSIEKKVLDGYFINKLEAKKLIEIKNDSLEDIGKLFEISKSIKEAYNNKTISLCSIISTKVGLCSEDCKFCAQSIHNNTDIEIKRLPKYEEIETEAMNIKSSGINRFSLVSSGKGLKKEELKEISSYYRRLKEKSDFSMCASLGILNEEELIKLKESGVKTYHHNIETSRNYYSKIVSTHRFEDRINTINNAKRAGLRVCSGGIIGMGESLNDRLDFIFELRNLSVESIPINILEAIPGTHFENIKAIDEIEILKTLAVFRIVYPSVELIYAGGRRKLKNHQRRGIEIAVNGMISGDFLTTSGNKIEEDIDMVKGYTVV